MNGKIKGYFLILFEFSKKVSKKFKYLCLYGKYCENIENDIFKEIVKNIKN